MKMFYIGRDGMYELDRDGMRRLDKVTGEPKLSFGWTLLAGIVLWAIGTVPFIIAYQVWSKGGFQ